jgi:hypothetical protein
MSPLNPSQPTNQAASGEPPASDRDATFTHPAANFLAGALLSGVPIWSYLLLSISMTHTPLMTVGAVKLGAAISIPGLVGLVAARYPTPVLRWISEALESANLPF